jgi:hypothetical protein
VTVSPSSLGSYVPKANDEFVTNGALQIQPDGADDVIQQVWEKYPATSRDRTRTCSSFVLAVGVATLPLSEIRNVHDAEPSKGRKPNDC